MIERAPRLIAREDDDVSAAIQDDPRSRGHRGPRSAPSASASPSGDSGGSVDRARRPSRGRRHAPAARDRPSAQHRRPRPGPRRRRDGRAAATSSSTTSCAPASPASGRSATATAAAPSPHTSYNDYEIVAANLLDGEPRRVSDRIPTYGLFIDPPLGRAGMTEAEVRKRAGRRWSAGGR